jgi:hypothetical protein
MSSYFVSESLAAECPTESADITNEFIIERLEGGHDELREKLAAGLKVLKAIN